MIERNRLVRRRTSVAGTKQPLFPMRLLKRMTGRENKAAAECKDVKRYRAAAFVIRAEGILEKMLRAHLQGLAWSDAVRAVFIGQCSPGDKAVALRHAGRLVKSFNCFPSQ